MVFLASVTDKFKACMVCTHFNFLSVVIPVGVKKDSVLIRSFDLILMLQPMVSCRSMKNYNPQ